MSKLNASQITTLLKYDENKTKLMAPKVAWPHEADLKTIAEAFRARKRKLVLSTGKFIIKHYDDKRSQLLVIPEQGFVPCGWFDYKTLEDVLK